MRFEPTSVIRVRREKGISTKMEEKPQQGPITMSHEHMHESAPINITSLKAGYVESKGSSGMQRNIILKLGRLQPFYLKALSPKIF